MDASCTIACCCAHMHVMAMSAAPALHKNSNVLGCAPLLLLQFEAMADLATAMITRIQLVWAGFRVCLAVCILLISWNRAAHRESWALGLETNLAGLRMRLALLPICHPSQPSSSYQTLIWVCNAFQYTFFVGCAT